MRGEDSQGRIEAAGDQSWTLDTYSGTTCLICGFTYPSIALAAEGGTVMRTKVSRSLPEDGNPPQEVCSLSNSSGTSARIRFPTDPE